MFVSTMIGLTLVACGPGNQAAYQGMSSNCSLDFVSDYNRVVSAAKFIRTTKDINDLESVLGQFESKYKGVVCVAEERVDSQLDKQNTTINVNEFVSKLRKAIQDSRI